MNSTFTRVCKTENDLAIAIIRIVLAAVMFAHVAQKMLGWFGGHGPSWTIEKWTGWFGLPGWVTALVIVGEFFGSILMLVGVGTRIMAFVTALIMIGAVYFVHFRWGFYMNWYNEQGRGEGFEYHLLTMSMCIFLIMRGSGALSFDRMLTNRKK